MESAPRYRKITSRLFAQILCFAVFADLADGFIDFLQRKRLTGAINPDTMFFAKLTMPPRRTQSDFLARAFNFETIACLQPQLVPELFWENDSSCLVECQSGRHKFHSIMVFPTCKW